MKLKIILQNFIVFIVALEYLLLILQGNVLAYPISNEFVYNISSIEKNFNVAASVEMNYTNLDTLDESQIGMSTTVEMNQTDSASVSKHQTDKSPLEFVASRVLEKNDSAPLEMNQTEISAVPKNQTNKIWLQKDQTNADSISKNQIDISSFELGQADAYSVPINQIDKISFGIGQTDVESVSMNLTYPTVASSIEINQTNGTSFKMYRTAVTVAVAGAVGNLEPFYFITPVTAMQLLPKTNKLTPSQIHMMERIVPSTVKLGTRKHDDGKRILVTNSRKKSKATVYSNRFVTFAKVRHDTGFNLRDRFTINKVRVDHYAPRMYNPMSDASNQPTLCYDSVGSTIYNKYHVMEYLKDKKYRNTINFRPVFQELRREIYMIGEADECHTVNQTDFEKFITCQIMRNMRLESLIPQYPLHQM